MKILEIIADFLGIKENQEKTIAKNTVWLFFAEGVSYLLKFIWVVYVIRVLGANNYGQFSFALGFVSLFAVFADFGLSLIITREFAKDGEEEKNFSALLTLKIFLSFLTFFIIIAGCLLITTDPFIRTIMLILGIFIVIDSFPEFFYAFFRARQKMKYESLVKIGRSILLIVFGFLAIFFAPSIMNISLAYLLSSTISVLILWFLFHRIFHKVRLIWDFNIWKRFLSLAWPLAVIGIFATIYSQIDSSIMGYFGQITETGWYNAVYRVIGALMMPITLISTGFFPALNTSSKESKDKFQSIYSKFIRVVLFLAIPIMIGGVTLAPQIINWLYDPSYLPATFAFQILLIMVALSYIVTPLMMVFTALNQQKKIFWFNVIGALVNLGLNIWLIPKYSLNAAAITTLLSVLLILILFIILAIRKKLFILIDRPILKTLLLCCVASLSMFLVLIILPKNIHIILSLTIGLFTYLISVGLLAFINPLLKRLNCIKIHYYEK